MRQRRLFDDKLPPYYLLKLDSKCLFLILQKHVLMRFLWDFYFYCSWWWLDVAFSLKYRQWVGLSLSSFAVRGYVCLQIGNTGISVFGRSKWVSWVDANYNEVERDSNDLNHLTRINYMRMIDENRDKYITETQTHVIGRPIVCIISCNICSHKDDDRNSVHCSRFDENNHSIP